MTPRILCVGLCIAFAVMTFAIVIGVPLAWLIARLPHTLSRIIELLLFLALLTVPTLPGIVIHRALLQNMMPWTLIQHCLPWMSSITIAAAIDALTVSLPVLILLVAAAFRSVDQETVLAARTLGMRRTAIIGNVILPQARAGIITGAILCCARAIGESTAAAVTLADDAVHTGDLLETLETDIRSGAYLLVVLWIAGWLLLAGLMCLLMHLCGRHRTARHAQAVQ